MILKRLLAAFILLSFVTQTSTATGYHPILSRLTISDIFGALALLLGGGYLLKSYNLTEKYSSIYRATLFMLFCFIIPVLFSLNIRATLLECVILLFLFMISLLIFYTFRNHFLDELLPLMMYTIIAASLLGIYDYGAGSVGLPRIFPSRAQGEILSGFRNAGQAGAYFLVFITILYPLLNSKLSNILSKKNKNLLRITVVISFVFLGLTGKIAAYIGLFIGLLGFTLFKRNLKAFVSLGLMSLGLGIIYINLQYIAPTVYERITLKYQTRIVNNLNRDPSNNGDNFIVSNLSEAIHAFKDNPISGSGLGGFVNNYGEHEVHSTYFKMIGETGLLGILGYVTFMFSFLVFFRRHSKGSSNPYYDYLRSMFPFILGCLVSWGYTYHVRKREFWILVSVLMIVTYTARKYKMKTNTNVKDEVSKIV